MIRNQPKATQSAGRFLIFSALMGLPLFAQQPFVPAPHRPVPLEVPPPGHSPHASPAVPRSMVGGFWRTDPNYKSALYLKNGLANSSITATPVLYLSNGVPYTLPDVALEPAGTAIVDINAALQRQGIAPWATLSGYIEVRYQWGWDALCATVRNVDPVHSELFNFNLRPSSPPGAPNRAVPLEGLWWKQEPNIAGFLALTNLSSNSLDATVLVSDQANTALGQHTVSVVPHGTKLVNMAEVRSSASRSGGIRITLDGLQRDWVVSGWLEDPATGYSANIPVSFPLPSATAQQPAPSVAELGLMTGAASPMLSFPSGTVFTPYSLLRNISNQAVSVTPTLWWMEGAAPRSAQLAPVTLAPKQAQSLDVPSLVSSAGLRNLSGSVNLVLDVSGPRSALLFAAGSVDQKNTYVFQVTPSAVSESVGTSFSYWSTGDGDDTMVTLWNPADEEQDLLFTLRYSGGGHYAYPVHLDPRATRAFSISEVIRSQVPDSEGNVVPLSVHEGNATLTGSKSKAEHILVAMEMGTYNVQKATCGNYCVNCSGSVSVFIDPGNGDVDVGTSMQLTFTSLHDDGFYYNISNDYGTSWSSSDSSVASMSGSSVRGVSPGVVQITATDISEPVYVSSCGYQVPYDCSYFYGVSTYVPENVHPRVDSISPSLGLVGASTDITITGAGFGSAPSISADDPSISVTINSISDTQITATAVIDGSDSDGNATLTVNVNAQPSKGRVFGRQLPGSLKVVSSRILSVQESTALGCGPLYNGIMISIVYQVLDRGGNVIANNTMVPQEKVVNYVLNGQREGDPQPNWVDITVGMKTNSDGTFPDHPFGQCGTGSFTSSDTQYIAILVGATRYGPYGEVRTNNWTYSSSAPGHGRISNGVDVTQQQ